MQMMADSRTEEVQDLLNGLEERLEKNPEDYDSVWHLPSDLFTYESKERIVAAIDYYNRLNKAENIDWVCMIVVGSAVHGKATSISDLDILPVYNDSLPVYNDSLPLHNDSNDSKGFLSQYEKNVSSFVNNVASEVIEEYGFEISPKLLPYSIMERVVLSGCDNPPYFVLGNRKEFYKIYSKTN